MKTQLSKPAPTKARYTEEYKKEALERRKGDKANVAIARRLRKETQSA